MKLFAESIIDSAGRQYMTWMTKQPRTNFCGLYEGGMMYSFDLDHKHNMTELHKYTFKNGAPVWKGLVKRWRGELLSKGEQEELMRMQEVKDRTEGGAE